MLRMLKEVDPAIDRPALYAVPGNTSAEWRMFTPLGSVIQKEEGGEKIEIPSWLMLNLTGASYPGEVLGFRPIVAHWEDGAQAINHAGIPIALKAPPEANIISGDKPSRHTTAAAVLCLEALVLTQAPTLPYRRSNRMGTANPNGSDTTRPGNAEPRMLKFKQIAQLQRGLDDCGVLANEVHEALYSATTGRHSFGPQQLATTLEQIAELSR
jgi:hypothetical protein